MLDAVKTEGQRSLKHGNVAENSLKVRIMPPNFTHKAGGDEGRGDFDGKEDQ